MEDANKTKNNDLMLKIRPVLVITAIISLMGVATGCDSKGSGAAPTAPEVTIGDSENQKGTQEVGRQDDEPDTLAGSRSISRSANSSGTALSNAHNMLGKNPYGQMYICLKYVRSWSGLGAKYATAAAAMNHYKSVGVFHSGSDPKKAPKSAWLFYDWGSYGHVAMRCGEGAIHQDNSSSGKGKIGHDSDGKVGGCTYRGYVTYEDAVRKW